MTLARLLAAAAVLAAAGCVAPPPPPAVHECERDARGGERVTSFTASGGAALRLDVATSPLRLPRPEAIGAGEHTVTLWLRVACERRDGATCDIGVRGAARRERRTVAPSGHRERFDWQALVLPAAEFVAPATAGSADPPVEMTVAGAGELLLDQFAWGSRETPPEKSASPPVWCDGRLELRAGFDAKVADPEWALHLLREQYTAVARLCGRELEGPVVLVALSSSQWPRDATGAFQNGCAIFLRDRELHLPWRSFAHEIAHLFEEQGGLPLPRFWSEGFACAVADEVEAALYDRGVARARVRWRRLLAEGDELHRPGTADPNRAIAWSDAAAGDRRDYEWAGAVVDALAQAGGAGFYARVTSGLVAPANGLVAALAAERDESGRVSIAAAPFLAAAGEQGAAILRSAGVPYRPLPAAGESGDATRP